MYSLDSIDIKVTQLECQNHISYLSQEFYHLRYLIKYFFNFTKNLFELNYMIINQSKGFLDQTN